MKKAILIAAAVLVGVIEWSSAAQAADRDQDQNLAVLSPSQEHIPLCTGAPLVYTEGSPLCTENYQPLHYEWQSNPTITIVNDDGNMTAIQTTGRRETQPAPFEAASEMINRCIGWGHPPYRITLCLETDQQLRDEYPGEIAKLGSVVRTARFDNGMDPDVLVVRIAVQEYMTLPPSFTMEAQQAKIPVVVVHTDAQPPYDCDTPRSLTYYNQSKSPL
ncbi:MAG: hypothetical protein LBJ69_03480 [Holosporales bacterium]|jgi:hypothetical protein|nr:hypothetical protein [Holosporales bacterium]